MAVWASTPRNHEELFRAHRTGGGLRTTKGRQTKKRNEKYNTIIFKHQKEKYNTHLHKHRKTRGSKMDAIYFHAHFFYRCYKALLLFEAQSRCRVRQILSTSTLISMSQKKRIKQLRTSKQRKSKKENKFKLNGHIDQLNHSHLLTQQMFFIERFNCLISEQRGGCIGNGGNCTYGKGKSFPHYFALSTANKHKNKPSWHKPRRVSVFSLTELTLCC